jgi:hypothetical protein
MVVGYGFTVNGGDCTLILISSNVIAGKRTVKTVALVKGVIIDQAFQASFDLFIGFNHSGICGWK